MKRFVLFCLLFINSVSLLAGEIVWYEGSVVLKTNVVLTGEISIEPQYDLILHRIHGKMEVYPAHKIQSIYFYDAKENINRKFISLKDSRFFNHHQLLEIVLKGEVSIYRRQKAWTGKSPSDADGFHYFVRYQDKLVDLQKFRNQVYPHLLKSTGGILSAFMDERKLNPNSPSNAILIIDFYNHIKKEDHILAMH
ncbi:MAG TPA: hypothetical protein PLJ60_16590 [Chryseolinea sp.]|nr:hypothetical protein [Chryseolinea sp.]HPH45909.1 hypothetical protein [Chryseolinea sp.]HPM31955.1 hypothetical protein [Chryseolinea sp.]